MAILSYYKLLIEAAPIYLGNNIFMYGELSIPINQLSRV